MLMQQSSNATAMNIIIIIIIIIPAPSVAELLVIGVICIAESTNQSKAAGVKQTPEPNGGQQSDGNDDAPSVNCKEGRGADGNSDEKADPAGNPYLQPPLEERR